jgi:hypothetical protein
MYDIDLCEQWVQKDKVPGTLKNIVKRPATLIFRDNIWN